MLNVCYKTKTCTDFKLDYLQTNLTIRTQDLDHRLTILGIQRLKRIRKEIIPRIIDKYDPSLIPKKHIIFKDDYLNAPNFPTFSIMWTGNFWKRGFSDFVRYKHMWEDISNEIMELSVFQDPIKNSRGLQLNPTYRLSRLDIAIDFFNIPMSDFKFAKKSKKLNLYADENGYLTSVTFGDRKNAWMLFRCYDKGLEQKSTKYKQWVRFEWEFKKDKLERLGLKYPKNFINAYSNTTYSSILVKACRNFMDGYPTGTGMNANIRKYRITSKTQGKLFSWNKEDKKIRDMIKTKGNEFITKMEDQDVSLRLYNPFSSVIGLLKNHGEMLSHREKQIILQRLNL